jgi:hypothetical protein
VEARSNVGLFFYDAKSYARECRVQTVQIIKKVTMIKKITVYSFWVKSIDAEDTVPFYVKQVIAHSAKEAESKLKNLGFKVSTDPYFLSSKNKSKYIRETYVRIK